MQRMTHSKNISQKVLYWSNIPVSSEIKGSSTDPSHDHICNLQYPSFDSYGGGSVSTGEDSTS
jgi:hypothetical protein